MARLVVEAIQLDLVAGMVGPAGKREEGPCLNMTF